MIEIGQYVGGLVLQGAPECGQLCQGLGHSAGELGDDVVHHLLALGPVGFAVGGGLLTV